MEFEETGWEGLKLVKPKVFKDDRGVFVKWYHRDLFQNAGIHFTPVEEYFSVSRKDVVRGMHFQTPPSDHGKLVYCSRGAVLDLRKNHSTYGKVFSAELSDENYRALYVPSGMAHGFLSLRDETVMHYAVGTVYDPENDAGILWSSIDFDWPIKSPVTSKRDATFPDLPQWESPFV